MKVVIVLPTYNEKGNVEKIIETLENDIFPGIKNHTMSILVADDMSPDGTAEEVKKLMKKYKNLELNIGEKKGLGAAYIRGMAYAIDKMGADIMFEMDADGQHDQAKIPEFLKKIDEGYDMVVGTRYSDGGSIPVNWPPIRKAYSFFGNLLVRSILMRFSIHDWTGGYRAVRKEVFLKEKKELTNFKGYTFQVSFLHKTLRDGFKVAEVPFHFTDRTLGDSKIAPKEYIVDLLKYIFFTRFKELERFIKFLVVGGTGFLLQVLTQEISIALRISDVLGIGLISFISLVGIRIIDTSTFFHGVGAGLGAEAAILSNFFFNNIWTFQDTKHIKESSNAFVKLLKFNMTSLASIFLQATAVWGGEKLLGEHMRILTYTVPVRILILFPTIILIVIPLNYLIYNKIIWKTQYLKNGEDK